MTHARLAPMMGLMMGAMIPFAIHGPGAGLGVGIVLGHAAVALVGAAAFLLAPPARRWLTRHRPTRAMILPMLIGVAAGAALICVHCLATLHGTV